MQEEDRRAEFSSLREEIHLRIRNRNWLLTLPFAVVGATISDIVAGHPWMILVCSLGVLPIALEWSYNDCRIRDIATYIQCFIETENSGFRWQDHLSKLRFGDVDWHATAAAAFMFLGVIGICIARWYSERQGPMLHRESGLLVVNFCAAVFVIVLVLRRSRRRRVVVE